MDGYDFAKLVIAGALIILSLAPTFLAIHSAIHWAAEWMATRAGRKAGR